MEDSLYAPNAGEQQQVQSPSSFSYLNIQNENDLLVFMPRQFECRIKSFRSLEQERAALDRPDMDSTWFHSEIRLKMNTAKELQEWLEAFEHITNTKWNKSRGARKVKGSDKFKAVLFKQDLECQHSKLNKAKEYRNDKVKRKNEFCEARMYIRIRRDTVSSKRRDPFYGYFGHVSIKWTHSHPIGSAKSLNYLRNPQLKELFESEYFEKGMQPSAACQARKEYVQTLPGFDPSWLENRSICPDRRQAWRWFDSWRTHHPTPLPAPTSKRNTASRSKRDACLSRAADLLTERFGLLTGNPSLEEVDILKELCDNLEKADTKAKMLQLLKGPPGGIQATPGGSKRPLPIYQEIVQPKRERREIFVQENDGFLVEEEEEEMEEFGMDLEDTVVGVM